MNDPAAASAITLHPLRSASGPGPSRGVVLGMPGLVGHTAIVAAIAAHALQDYDVWTFSVDANDRQLTEGAWFACAREVADRILAGEVGRPRAMMGFSLGGLIAWLVARMLTDAGRAAPPIINFDGAAPHVHMTAWRDRIASLSPSPSGADLTRMLLLCRGSPGPFRLVDEVALEWGKAGAIPETIRYRTLDHLDMVLPQAIAASSDALARFIETGRPAPKRRPEMLDFDTAGGASFRLLDGRSTPEGAAVRALAGENSLPNDASVRLGLLVLAIATRDLNMALDFTRRMIAAEPGHRAATYARIALLSVADRQDEALETARMWLSDFPTDVAMQARTVRSPEQPRSWRSAEIFILGSDGSLDFAIAVAAAGSHRLA